MAALSEGERRLSTPEATAAANAWLLSAQAQHVLDWEQQKIDGMVGDIFGFNAVQLGWPLYPALRASRISQRLVAGVALPQGSPVQVCCNADELPFANASIDLLLLPHVLEFSSFAPAILRESERVLIGEGHLILTGFNPLSGWGLKRRFDRSRRFPWRSPFLSPWRVRHWLEVLGFELGKTHYGCYLPFADSLPQGLWQALENIGRHLMPFAGGVYLIHAVKRVPGTRRILPAFPALTLRQALVPQQPAPHVPCQNPAPSSRSFRTGGEAEPAKSPV